MSDFRSKSIYSKHVTAVFPGRALSFDWPDDATLEDLAECLVFLGEGGAPLRVDVRIDE
jgi:hypothetical protein